MDIDRSEHHPDHMRNIYTLFILIFLLPFSAVHAQSDATEKAFLQYFFKKITTKKTPLRYLKDHDYRELSRKILQDPISDAATGSDPSRVNNKLILTKQEKKYLSARLHQFRTLNWKEHLLPNSALISRDTLDRYLKNEVYGNGWEKLYDRGIQGFYSFSRPIFLRNETLCIFQADYYCGSLCGWGNITIYRKENKVWKPYINLISWVS